MSKLFIDDKAIEFIKKALAEENKPAARLFVSGGGCCKQFEITPVGKALAGDVTFRQGGVTVHIEKELADVAQSISIRSDEKRGLLIEFE
ncbi:MAG: hypothetical protein OIN66_06015 [Candidatus Methanoperedens sp.]|nr:hypothetical protein [Candidatus Methanoperedens sp.]